MTLIQKLAAKGVTLAAVLSVGAIGSGSAQAAIIKGSVTGIWEDNTGSGTYVTAGDEFTATYEYDDTTLTLYTNSYTGFYEDIGYFASLLSLVVTSGNYSHTFDFLNGSGRITFGNFTGDPSTYPYAFKFLDLRGSDYTASGYNSFNASQSIGKFYDGTPLNSGSAYLFTDDGQANVTDEVSTYKNYNNVTFALPPTNAVPTPALLPGLIGLGLSVIRKRRAEVAQQEAEA